MASAANYVVDDLKKTPEQPGPGSYEPEDAANYLAREGVLEAASFNMEGLNPTDPDDRRQIIKLMDSTARAWASRSKANPKTNPFFTWSFHGRRVSSPPSTSYGCCRQGTQRSWHGHWRLYSIKRRRFRPSNPEGKGPSQSAAEMLCPEA